MYGKIFGSMYEGSLVGAGSHVFAVLGYVISKQVPDRVVGSQVELNPKLLAFVLGESESKVLQAIEFLCSPDPKSRTKGSDGRRLIQLGEYAYQVVNGAKYRAIRDEEARREQNREAKRRERANGPKKHKAGGPSATEQNLMNALKNGDDLRASQIQAYDNAKTDRIVKAERKAREERNGE